MDRPIFIKIKFEICSIIIVTVHTVFIIHFENKKYNDYSDVYMTQFHMATKQWCKILRIRKDISVYFDLALSKLIYIKVSHLPITKPIFELGVPVIGTALSHNS